MSDRRDFERTSSPTTVGERRSPAPRLERLEASNAGRWLLSAVLVFNLTAVVVWNSPNSSLRDLALPVVRPYLNAVGLSQSWAIFAPDPATQTFELVATIDYADGTSGSWRPPEGDPLIGRYRTYRWRKWAGSAHLEAKSWMWEPTARWVEDNHDHGGRQPIRIELVRRWRDLKPPTSGEPDSDWHEYVYYTLELGEEASS